MTRRVRVAILAYPGVDELDLFGAYAILAKAADSDSSAESPLEVVIAAREARVTGAGGITFEASHPLQTVLEADAAIIPGGRGSVSATADPELIKVLRQAASRGITLYAICTGALLVAAAGLAEDRRLAVHPAKRELLAEYRTGEITEGLVRDGGIVSVGGQPGPSVKSIDAAFQVLADLRPHLLEPVRQRTELRPGRRLVEAS